MLASVQESVNGLGHIKTVSSSLDIMMATVSHKAMSNLHKGTIDSQMNNSCNENMVSLNFDLYIVTCTLSSQEMQQLV